MHSKNFRKFRINKKRGEVNNDLQDQIRELKGEEDEKSKEELNKLYEKLADKAQENFQKAKEALNEIIPGDETVNTKKLWKFKKKLCPKTKDPPTAMLDNNGNLLTTNKSIEKRVQGQA